MPPQNDVNLTSPLPCPPTCTDTTTVHGPLHATSPSVPFKIGTYIAAAIHLPPSQASPLPDGVLKGRPAPNFPVACTRGLVHRFYQEQYEIKTAARWTVITVGSDAIGLSRGVFLTRTRLPIYRYLASASAAASTWSPTTSSRQRSAARSSTING